MKVAHICPETGGHYLVSARWNGDRYEPCCGHCDDREVTA
jgi:hypothetical protein